MAALGVALTVCGFTVRPTQWSASQTLTSDDGHVIAVVTGYEQGGLTE